MYLKNAAAELSLTVGSVAHYLDAYQRPQFGTVTKITASGQIVVKRNEYEIRFMANGHQHGATSQRRYAQLCTAETYALHKARRQEDMLRNEARALLQDLAQSPIDADLLSKLDAVRAKVAALVEGK